MESKIQTWGNSQGVRLSKSLLKDSNMGVGDEVEILAENGKIIIQPKRKIHGKFLIQDLVMKMPADYSVEEIDWGKPTGKEAW